MIRRAETADCRRILAIRDAPGERPLSDPRTFGDRDAARLTEAGTLLVWEDAPGLVTGFIAVDAGNAAVAALLVAAGHDGKGIGRALLAAGCEALRQAGHAAMTLTLEPGAAAERHYRAAGWTVVGETEGVLVLRKSL